MANSSDLHEQLNNNPFAMNLAAEEAMRERIAKTDAAAQEEALNAMRTKLEADTGLTVRFAQQVSPAGPPAPPKLEFYQAAELYGKQLERTQMVVQRMIPCGLTVLAGAPKRGKSWLALALGIAVASGADFLGQHTLKGSVLYLDLESRQYRVKDRLSKLIHGPAPAGLYIAHTVEAIGQRFYTQIDDWSKQVESPRLVIIDTLGRIKPAGKRTENAYESDTKQYGALQAWAADRKIAVVVVHHLRKTKDSDDWFDKINGSNGLVGVADAVLGLAGMRGEDLSKLMVSGRDIDGDYTMAIRFADGKWVLESSDSDSYESEAAFIRDPVVRGIFTFMYDRYEWSGTATQLIDDIVEYTREPFDCGGAAGIGRCMRDYATMLYEREGILFAHKRSGQRRLILLRNTRLKPAQTKMEGVPDEPVVP